MPSWHDYNESLIERGRVLIDVQQESEQLKVNPEEILEEEQKRTAPTIDVFHN